MAVKAPQHQAPVAAVSSWTGFYLFGGVGGGVWDATNVSVTTATGSPLTLNQRQGGDGWFGTAGAGYDWQFNKTWVTGVFADGQFGSLRGSIQDENFGATGTEKLRNTWAAGGRLGWLVSPNVLSYVNAGYTQTYWSASTLFPVRGGAQFASTPSFNTGGFFVGGGVENNLDIFGITAPGWFMKTEYRAAYLGTTTLPETLVGGAPVGTSQTFKPLVQTIETSLVYRFNSGSVTPAAMYTKAPALPSHNWTGFYLFGGAGGGVWDATNVSVVTATGAPVTAGQRQGGDGWFGTAGAGYDWQFNKTWVTGVFADGQFGSLRGSIQDENFGYTGTEKLRDTWAAGGRLGWLVSPQVFSYVNAGYTQSYWSGSTLFGVVTRLPIITTPSFNKGGFFVGGGVENNLDIFGITAPGWFMKTEYRAAYFGKATLIEGLISTGGLPFGFSQTFQPLVQTISTSLVYRFN
jgi:outer membrane immunogenic protein